MATVRIFNTHLDWVHPLQLWVDVVVEETLQGTVEHDTMTILASHGTSCDPGFEEFQIGDKLIVHIGEAEGNSPTEWYSFEFNNGCREEYLKLVNDQVAHFVSEKWVNESYQNFKNNLAACAALTHVFDKEVLEYLVSLFPNPASAEVIVQNNSTQVYDFTLFAPTGQLLLHQSVVNERTHRLPTLNLANGIYIVRLQFGDVSLVKKLVVKN